MGLSTALFVAAGSAAKSWAISHESSLLLVLTLSLYTAGNLVVLRLIRDYGQGIAISLSAMVQVLIVNVIAFGISATAYPWFKPAALRWRLVR